MRLDSTILLTTEQDVSHPDIEDSVDYRGHRRSYAFRPLYSAVSG